MSFPISHGQWFIKYYLHCPDCDTRSPHVSASNEVTRAQSPDTQHQPHIRERSPGVGALCIIHSITLHTPLFAELIQDKLRPQSWRTDFSDVMARLDHQRDSVSEVAVLKTVSGSGSLKGEQRSASASWSLLRSLRWRMKYDENWHR